MQSEQFVLHSQIEERHWWFTARRRVMRNLVRRLLPDRGATVVDIGCGTGANIAALADDYRCVGIDTSVQAIKLARERYPAVKFVHGFAPDDVRADFAQAGVVLLMDVLEHVPDDFRLFSQLFAAARPSTKFLVTVPADIRLWSQHDVSFGHYRRYHDARLAQVWQGLPARCQLLSYFNCRLYPLVRLARTLSRWRGRSAGASGTDFRVPARPVNRCLEAVFAGEERALGGMLQGRRRPYRRGVSLIAVVERLAGEVIVRDKPADIEPDFFDPRGTGLEPVNS